MQVLLIISAEGCGYCKNIIDELAVIRSHIPNLTIWRIHNKSLKIFDIKNVSDYNVYANEINASHNIIKNLNIPICTIFPAILFLDIDENGFSNKITTNSLYSGIVTNNVITGGKPNRNKFLDWVIGCYNNIIRYTSESLNKRIIGFDECKNTSIIPISRKN